jgi:hypothetical protein
MKTRSPYFLRALVVVLVIASLHWLVPLSRTSQEEPVQAADVGFKGKVLLVNSSNTSAFLLEKACVQKVGIHSCLVGKGVGEGRMMSWTKGRTVCLLMEHIVAITEFDDLKEAKKAIESAAGNPFGGDGLSVPIEGPKTAHPGRQGAAASER